MSQWHRKPYKIYLLIYNNDVSWIPDINYFIFYPTDTNDCATVIIGIVDTRHTYVLHSKTDRMLDVNVVQRRIPDLRTVYHGYQM